MARCWEARQQDTASTNLAALQRSAGFATFEDLHRWSIDRPEEFWTQTLRRLGVAFSRPPDCFADLSGGRAKPQWFKGGKLNIAASCFARENQTAIVTKRHTGELQKISLSDLHAQVKRTALSLDAMGLKSGDAVAIFMPMTAEAVAIYLAIVLAGMTVVSIPESIPPEQVATRLKIANARLVFSQSYIARSGKRLALYERLTMPEAEAPKIVCLPLFGETALPPLREGDIGWQTFLSSSTTFDAVACDPQAATNIIFSSGTTGTPKAIVWDHVTPVKAASDGHYHQDIRSGDCVCWPTSLGWMMGPWLVYASLLNSAAIALYEGGPGDPGFAAFIEEAKVTMLGLVPSIAAAWRQSGIASGRDWSELRTFSSSGEASNPDLYDWLSMLNQPAGIKKPIIEYCGGTEIGGGYIAGNLLKPLETSAFNGPVMGIDFAVLDDSGRACAPGTTGEIFIKTPSLGLATSILNADIDKVYYEGAPQGLRRHGDLMTVLPGGAWRSNGRAGNDMNLNGIKVGSTEIEQAVSKVAGVVEAAAVGVPPPGGGPDRLVLFVVVSDEGEIGGLQNALQRALKENLGPFYIVHDVVLVPNLPRTASNKVMHRELRASYAARTASAGSG